MDLQNIHPLAPIFFGHSLKEQIRIITENKRFVHYTNSDAAVGMIRNEEVWMRKSTVMNDFSEIEHGLASLKYAYGSEVGVRFKAVLNGIHPGAAEEVEKLFDSWLPHFRVQTYLTCISEHEDDEDDTGRLSMWRAYGSVAIVLNKDVFMSQTDALKAYSSPVAYMMPESFKDAFNSMTSKIASEAEYLRSLDRNIVVANAFSMLRYAVLCTKHPGFREEREWRIIYSPTYEPSTRIKKEVEVVRGVPQMVCKIPLQDAPEEGLVGLNLNALIDRIIIGPNQYPYAQLEAYVELLEQKRVQDAAAKVVVSHIPLRQQ